MTVSSKSHQGEEQEEVGVEGMGGKIEQKLEWEKMKIYRPKDERHKYMEIKEEEHKTVETWSG